MNEPKISVLIPLYNRKIYSIDCIKSVLQQTFQDFEIIVRDDFSTDGVFELVQKEFLQQISAGKIKIFRNEKNLGEAVTTKKLFDDAKGKYVTVLHNDDLYLPHALNHLFEVAENFQADVVHGSNFLISPSDGIIKNGTHLRKISRDNNPASQLEIMPTDLNFRFNEWWSGGTFQDPQHNIFRKNFLLESKILEDMENGDNYLFALKWIMKSKTFVKTPEVFYIYRDSSTSQTNENAVTYDRLEKAIDLNIKVFRQIDKFVSEFEFFRDKKDLQYLVKAKIFTANESLTVEADKPSGNKKYADLYHSIEKVFKKSFGNDGVYLALLYHWSHIMQLNKSQVQKNLQDCLNLIYEDI